MPFDSAPDAEVTARDRVIRLRDFLARLPDPQFDMSDYLNWKVGPNRYHMPIGLAVKECGTAACIAGWAQVLFDPTAKQDEWIAQKLLGLSEEAADALFRPRQLGYYGDSDVYTLARAVAVLDNYLATGLIDWSVASRLSSGSEGG